MYVCVRVSVVCICVSVFNYNTDLQPSRYFNSFPCYNFKSLKYQQQQKQLQQQQLIRCHTVEFKEVAFEGECVVNLFELCGSYDGYNIYTYTGIAKQIKTYEYVCTYACRVCMCAGSKRMSCNKIPSGYFHIIPEVFSYFCPSKH